MRTNIFRKVALERLSSPEQLDQLLQVTSARSWIALFAIFGLLGLAIAWGYMGSVAMSAMGQGVIVRSGGVENVVSLGAGRLTDMELKVGDHVQVGQIIGHVEVPELDQQIRSAKEALAELIAESQRIARQKQSGVELALEMVQHRRSNLAQSIRDAEREIEIVRERMVAEAELLEKGLITREQALETEQRLVNIEARIADSEAQIEQLDSETFLTQAEPVNIEADYRARINEARRRIASLEKDLELASRIESAFSGAVIEVRVDPGILVQLGSPIVTLEVDESPLEALIYINSSEAKDVEAGMVVELSPSTVKREEFGFMLADVVQVAEFPASPAALMRHFENESLVNSLSSSGPVTEIRVSMREKPSTVSGFEWSSQDGPPVTISSGTLCTARVVTSEQAPITLVFPILKETLGLT